MFKIIFSKFDDFLGDLCIQDETVMERVMFGKHCMIRQKKKKKQPILQNLLGVVN